MTDRRQILLLAALAVLIVALVSLLLTHHGRGPTLLSGYVESEPLYLAAPVAGTVTRLEVRRGDRVDAGALLFTVDNRSLTAQRDSAAAQIEQARAQQTGARETRAQLEAALVAARASAAEGDREAARARRLAAAGTLSSQDRDKALTAADTAHAQLAAAERQALAAEADIDTQGGRIRQYQGVQADAEARLSQTTAHAPAAARVEDVFFQPGEWASANQPILALLPDAKITIRFFVPQREIIFYRLGERVSFACDGCKTGLSAVVSYVSPRPEYTPPVIYSRESRDRLVFLVEARPDNPGGLAPGQPIDVTPLGR
jgi:HlyD family secretion protein